MGILDAKLYDYKLRANDYVEQPTLTATVEGVSGVTTYSYKACFKTNVGLTLPSEVLTITNGNATLSTANCVRLRCVSVPSAARSIEFFKKTGDNVFRKVGECSAALNILDDVGQSFISGDLAPTVDMSGRPEWRTIGWHHGKYLQRPELTDAMWLSHRDIKNLGDLTHRNGDIVTGLTPVLISGTTYHFAPGKVYIDGQFCTVSAGEVTLDGNGEEKVGVTVTPRVVTFVDDDYIRNIDEGSDPSVEQSGADRIVYDFVWGIDQPGQIEVQVFLDGLPKKDILDPERTVLDRKIAQGIYDVSGNFSIENFPLKVEAYTPDPNKFQLAVYPGYVYANGYPVKTSVTHRMLFDRSLDTAIVQNGSTDAFNTIGGSVISANAGPFDLNGKSIKLKVGQGNFHTVTFDADDMSASDVAAFVEDAINVYSTAGFPELLEGVANDAEKVQFRAQAGKTLEIATVTSDCYAILGISVEVYQPQGTRIYRLSNSYIKAVTDVSYNIEEVISVTHNATTNRDLLGTNITAIVGACLTAADCHDAKFTYLLNTSYIKDGNYIDWSLGGPAPSGGQTYYVKLRRNYSATLGVRNLIEVVDATLTKGAHGSADILSFNGATSIKSVATGLTVSGVSGSAFDVTEILRVNASAGSLASQYTVWSLDKNSNELGHDYSEINWSNATNAGTDEPMTGNTYYVSFRAWYHAVEGDFVVANSFDQYREIESQGNYFLRDCMDFRTSGGVRPRDEQATTLDYEFYLARVDKLVCDDAGNFTLIRGNPAAVSPIVPADKPNMLSIAILMIEPFTYSVDSVSKVSIESMRITQKGLHDLQKQMEWLRYYMIKNTLEQQRANQIAGVTGDVHGLFVDAVTGFGNTDVGFNKNGISQTAAIDMQKQQIRLAASKESVIIEPDLDASSGVRRCGNSVMLDYTPEVLITQDKAGITVNCASDFIYDNYVGHMALNPSVDVFIDYTQLPALNIVDEDNNLATAVATLWANQFDSIDWGNWRTTSGSGISQVALNELAATDPNAQVSAFYPWNIGGGMWGSLPAGYASQPTYSGVYQVRHYQTGTAERTGTRTDLIPNTITRSLGNLVVDMSLLYNMRTTNNDGSPFEIQVSVNGLMPNVDHTITINGISVDFVYDNEPVDHAGAAGTHTCQSKTTVCSSDLGRLTGKFVMPWCVPIGRADVAVFLYTGDKTSYASAGFYSQGFNIQQQETTIGIPSMETSIETVVETTPLLRIESQYHDPIAQSFFVPNNGSLYRYLCAAGVYFKSKSATLPITAQIRNMVNGFPGLQELASCTLYPDDVNISDNGTVETVFTFDNVLGYTAGQDYCLVMMPGKNNTDYEVFVSEMGTMDFVTQTIIGSQAHQGVFFHSPNAYTWLPETKRDLKFKLYESNFTDNMQLIWKNLTGIQASMFIIKIEEFIAPGASVYWFYSTDAGVSWIPVASGIDTELSQIITQVQLKVDVTSLGAAYSVVDKYAGILLLYFNASGYHVIPNGYLTDALTPPNKVTMLIDIAGDMEGQVVQPYYSIDDGDTWVKLNQTPDWMLVLAREPFYTYSFSTPPTVTITGATNATPIVITSVGHGYHDNAVVLIEGVGGNTAANGVYRLKNVTTDTAELFDVGDDTAIPGNGAYSDTGTMITNEFLQCRGLLEFTTDNRARTPIVMNPSLGCTRQAE